MKWFKFYGQDFLTDSKIGALNPFQKLMWITILCIASQDDKKTGILKFITEERVVELAGLNYDDMQGMYDMKRNVTFETLCNMNLLQVIDENTILVTNFNKLQSSNSSSTERVTAYRERKKAQNMKKTHVTNETNVTLHETQNVTLDKNRVDIITNVIRTKSKKYGNLEIEKILTLFDKFIGHVPADKSPRKIAQNIRQLIGSFVKRNEANYKLLRGKDLDFDYVLNQAFLWFSRKDYAHDTEKLETFKLKLKVFLDLQEKKLTGKEENVNQNTGLSGEEV